MREQACASAVVKIVQVGIDHTIKSAPRRRKETSVTDFIIFFPFEDEFISMEKGVILGDDV